MDTKNKLAPSMKQRHSLVSLLFGKSKSKWEAVRKGPATIHGYEVNPAEIEGTYVKEVDQYGEERYWVAEPGIDPYLRDVSSISVIN